MRYSFPEKNKFLFGWDKTDAAVGRGKGGNTGVNTSYINHFYFCWSLYIGLTKLLWQGILSTNVRVTLLICLITCLVSIVEQSLPLQFWGQSLRSHLGKASHSQRPPVTLRDLLHLWHTIIPKFTTSHLVLFSAVSSTDRKSSALLPD